MTPAAAGQSSGSNGTGSDDLWTVLRLILWSADYLEGKGVESGRLDAEHLLAHVLEVDRLRLYLDFERPLTSPELDGFRPLLRRRAAREPLQYIVGHQPFRELDLRVEPGVLIPRSETEALVEKVLEWAAARGAAPVNALDIGTGSGAIALSLAFEGSFASVVATDVDQTALSVARRNRGIAELDDRVELRLGPLFEPIGAQERFDLIVSNPPYVADDDEPELQPEVRDWEPSTALFGGPDGLRVMRGLAEGAADHLEPEGLVALEVGLGQAATVAALFREDGRYDRVEVIRDYSGRERFVFARRPD